MAQGAASISEQGVGEFLQSNEASPQQAAGYHKEGHCL